MSANISAGASRCLPITTILVLLLIVVAGVAAADGSSEGSAEEPGLRLSGVMVYAGHVERAIIVGPDGINHLVSAGDQLDATAWVAEIHRDHILLYRNGRLERLFLERGQETALPEEREVLRDEVSPSVEQAERLGMLRAALRNDHPRFRKQIDVRPVMEEGVVLGYRVAPRQPETFKLFRRVGLQPGDLITHVDGVPVSAREQLTDLLVDSPEMVLQVSRKEGSVHLLLQFGP